MPPQTQSSSPQGGAENSNRAPSDSSNSRHAPWYDPQYDPQHYSPYNPQYYPQFDLQFDPQHTPQQNHQYDESFRYMGGWGPEDPLEYLKEQREKRQKKKGQKGKKKNQQEQDQRSEEEASYHMSRFLSQEPHQEPWSHVSRGVWEK